MENKISLDDHIKVLEKLNSDLELLNSKIDEINAISKSTYSNDVYSKRTALYKERQIIVFNIMSEENIIKALNNGGTIIDIKDQVGFDYLNVPDFRLIDSSEFNFDESNVLISDVPKYVPTIDEDTFKSKSYLFDTIRITEDSYLICINKYNDVDKTSNLFIIVTLDQLVLIIDYYYSKAKAKNIVDANEKRSEASYNRMSEEIRKRYMFQKGIYNSIPASEKKKISEAEFEKLNLEQREAIYKPFKKNAPKRLVSNLAVNEMPTSFHKMYEDFINKEAVIIVNAQLKKGANPIVWKYWVDFREMINFKIKDIRIQREDYADTYKQALETSFGESNTDTSLKDKYGILVKRQNGDKISLVEINQIESSWIKIQHVFGDLKPNTIKYNIKVSHAGDKLIFAMKALGVYIPKMRTIGVSNKLGENEFESTFSHETAHFIDNFIGELNGKRWATDNYEGTAGKIAFTFRNNMNLHKSNQTDYINSTKECFARALQEYYLFKTYNEDAFTKNVDFKISTSGISLFEHPSFVNKIKFESEILPLIIQFFNENQDVFKTTVDLDGTNEPEPIVKENSTEIIESKSDAVVKPETEEITKDSVNEFNTAIETLNMLIDLGGSDDDIKEWKEALETLYMLLNSDKLEHRGVLNSYTENDMDDFTNLLDAKIKELGYLTRISKSKTDFGKSNYVFAVKDYTDLYSPNEVKIRISDHSVTNIDRIFNEYHIYFPLKADKADIIQGALNNIIYYFDRDKYFYEKEIEDVRVAYNVLTDSPNETDVITKEWVTKKGKQMYEVTRTYRKNILAWAFKNNDRVY